MTGFALCLYCRPRRSIFKKGSKISNRGPVQTQNIASVRHMRKQRFKAAGY